MIVPARIFLLPDPPQAIQVRIGTIGQHLGVSCVQVQHVGGCHRIYSLLHPVAQPVVSIAVGVRPIRQG